MSDTATMTFRALPIDRMGRIFPPERNILSDALTKAGDAAGCAASASFERLSHFLAASGAEVHHLGTRTRDSVQGIAARAQEAAGRVQDRREALRRQREDADRLAASDPAPLAPKAFQDLGAHFAKMRLAAGEGVRDAVQSDMTNPRRFGAAASFQVPQAAILARMDAIGECARAVIEERNLRAAERSAGQPLPAMRRGGFAAFAALEDSLAVARNEALAASRPPVAAPERTSRIADFAKSLRGRVAWACGGFLAGTGALLRGAAARASRLHTFLGDGAMRVHMGATQGMRQAAENRFARVGVMTVAVGCAAAYFLHSGGGHLPSSEALVATLNHVGAGTGDAYVQVAEKAGGLLHGLAHAQGQFGPDWIGNETGAHLASAALGHMDGHQAMTKVAAHVAHHGVPGAHGVVNHVTAAHDVAHHTAAAHAAHVDPGVRNIPQAALENAELEYVRHRDGVTTVVDWGKTSAADMSHAREAVIRAASHINSALAGGVDVGNVHSQAPIFTASLPSLRH